jgi:hypothetical protein
VGHWAVRGHGIQLRIWNWGKTWWSFFLKVAQAGRESRIFKFLFIYLPYSLKYLCKQLNFFLNCHIAF